MHFAHAGGQGDLPVSYYVDAVAGLVLDPQILALIELPSLAKAGDAVEVLHREPAEKVNLLEEVAHVSHIYSVDHGSLSWN